MIEFLTPECLKSRPTLASMMIAQRYKCNGALQKLRLQVHPFGLGADKFDYLDPIYIVRSDRYGRHVGSMRLMPLNGPTLLGERFCGTYQKHKLGEGNKWECSYYCSHPDSRHIIQADLLAAALTFMKEIDIEILVTIIEEEALFSQKVTSSALRLLSIDGDGENGHSVVSWKYSNSVYLDLLESAEVENVDLELAIANGQHLKLRNRLLPISNYI